MLSSHFVDRFLETMRENTWSMAGMTGTKSVYNGLVVTKHRVCGGAHRSKMKARNSLS